MLTVQEWNQTQFGDVSPEYTGQDRRYIRLHCVRCVVNNYVWSKRCIELAKL